MKRIPIDKAVPGQLLAEKLTRHDGVLLAGQGSEITEGLLRMLVRLNVDSVMVEEDDPRSAEEIVAEFEKFKEELEQRFVRVNDQAVLMALKKTMIFMAEKEKDEALAAQMPATDTISESEPNASPEASASPASISQNDAKARNSR